MQIENELLIEDWSTISLVQQLNTVIFCSATYFVNTKTPCGRGYLASEHGCSKLLPSPVGYYYMSVRYLVFVMPNIPVPFPTDTTLC